MWWQNNLLRSNIIYNTIIVIIVCFFTDGYNLLFKMFTIDSLISAVYFVTSFINKDISDSQIVTHISSLYTGSILDRYIYYFLQYCFYNILCWFLWFTDFNILYYLILITTLPPILNKIVSSDVFSIIIKKKEDFVKIIIAKKFASIIKFISKIYLNKDINVKYKELLPLLNNYKNTVSYFVTVLKNSLIILLMFYIKNYSPKFYYSIKYFYTYKTGDMISSFNANSAKKTLSNIIDNKQWDELLKPNVYRAIFHLYQENKEGMHYCSNFVSAFNYKLAKMFSIWTLSSFFNCIPIAPIISFFFLLYRTNIINNNFLITNKTKTKTNKLVILFNSTKKFITENIYQICIFIISYIIGLLTDNILLTSIMCQFGYDILINKVTIDLYKLIIKKFVKYYNIINNQNTLYIIPIVCSVIYAVIYGLMSYNIYTTILVCISMIYDIITHTDSKRQLVLSGIMLAGWLSSYNIFHILYLGFIYYVIFGLVDQNIYNMVYNNIYVCIRSIKQYKFTQLYKKNDMFIFDVMDIEKYPPMLKKSKNNISSAKFIIKSNYIDNILDIDKDKDKVNDLNNQPIIEILSVNRLSSSPSSVNRLSSSPSSVNRLFAAPSSVNRLFAAPSPVGSVNRLSDSSGQRPVSYSADSDVFNLSPDRFIEAISIEDNNISNQKKINIIENYC
jgi:hypothetical protein